jgi:hypothetical protein
MRLLGSKTSKAIQSHSMGVDRGAATTLKAMARLGQGCSVGDPSYPIVAITPQEAESKVHEMHAKLKEVEHKDSRISRHSTRCVVWMIFEPSYIPEGAWRGLARFR